MPELYGEQFLSPEGESFIDSFLVTQKKECSIMAKKANEVTFTGEELSTMHMILQGEVMKIGDVRNWFVKHGVELPQDVKYSEQIENLLSICNRLTCMILEGVPFNDKKYVLRSVSRDYTRNPDE